MCLLCNGQYCNDNTSVLSTAAGYTRLLLGISMIEALFY